ncbi:RNA polymerase sigma factor [uncultured Adlercreutzia sp.]|uniref:RNA polymerase sigma factor n=1 Tax=uncultured Adlercreutzia sp. TaxID=875803 RepID=UPI0026F3AF9F|nr:sigma-70 family RNA polymerase sigma factor [uncultured Adlercreutzia sp.]
MREEFEDIVRRQSAMVYRLAFSRLRNGADAEDVCQTVFLRLFRADPAFRDADHERAWLLHATVNCCNDVHRSAWRRNVLGGERAREAAERTLDRRAMRQQEEQANRSESAARIAEAMEALTEKQRTVVHLFYFEGLAGEEIAAATGERPSTVRSHLRRARKTLRTLLGGQL